MPTLSASSQSNACTRSRTRAAWPMIVAVWTATLSSLACRDTREDTNYCSACTSADAVEGTGTETNAQEGGSSAPSSEAPSTTSSGGVMTSPAMMSMPGQAGAGRAAQGAAATSGGINTSSGNNAATAGARAQQAGSAARAGNGGTAGGRPAATGGNGANLPRDAGTGEPEPAPDAGNPTPMPCNGQCPASIPVCDETKIPAECVQCTLDDQRECKGDTRTCDLEQNRCVQCTLNDARNCDRDTPVCNRENRCVRCTSERADSCPPAQPLCIDESRCVECRTNNDCLSGDRPMCNNDGQCVTCMNDAQCMDPKKPRCDANTNGCVGCEAESDCAGRFPATPHCDKQKKACVACLPDADMLCQGGQLCDASTNTCVPGAPSQANCSACNNDRDCAQSPSIAACIPHENGSYCFAAAIGSMPACANGYSAAMVQGRPQHAYCLPTSPLTCPTIAKAVNEMMCTSPADCGNGTQCPPMPDNRCRLLCNKDQDCPAPLSCDSGARVCKKKG